MRARKVWAGLAGIPLALAGVGLAHADNIQNEFVNDAGTEKSITTTGMVTVVYTIREVSGRGELPGCDATVASPAILTLDVPAQVVASASQLTFTSCGSSQNVTMTSKTPSSGPGYAIGHSVSDTAGNYNISSLDFNLKVEAATTTPTDTTAPSVTPVVTGTLGQNGWYTSDVSVSWDVTDGESAISSSSGCDTVLITEDQAETTYTCAATSAGGTTSRSVSVKRDATEPVITPDDVNSQSWRNGPLSQSFTASDAMSGIPAADGSFTLTVSAESSNGATTDSRTVTDAAGNSTTRTLSALIDTTGPQVTPDNVVDTTWRNTVLSQEFKASDALSGLANQADATFTLTASAESANQNTPTVVSKTVYDAAGNPTTRSVSAMIDKTAPEVTPASVVDTTWRNTDLSQQFQASDRLSGLADASDAGFTLTASEESADKDTPTVVSKTVYDAAGNTTERSVSAFIDKTAPTGVTISGGPQDGARYFPNNVPQATCSAVDALSGLDANGCVVSGYSTAVGTHTLVATATDRAGNVTTLTGPTYTVRTLTLTGFYAPVDKGIHNTVKNGATVPLKFEVFDQGVEVSATDVVKSFTTKTVSCTTLTSEDAVEELAGTSGTSLRYDATGGQFIQNWQTPKKSGTCYEVRMTTIDDSSISALFKLK